MQLREMINGKFWVLCLCLACIVSLSCGKDPDIASLSGIGSFHQVVPSIPPVPAQAQISGIYNHHKKELNYSLRWEALSGTATYVRLHGPAGPGQAAPALYPLQITMNGADGESNGRISNLPDSITQYIQKGLVYYSISTAAHPNGEVRGQVMVTR
jgi:hypothetical protein